MKKKKLIIIVGALVIGVGLGVLIYKLSEKHGNDNDNLGNVSQVAKMYFDDTGEKEVSIEALLENGYLEKSDNDKCEIYELNDGKVSFKEKNCERASELAKIPVIEFVASDNFKLNEWNKDGGTVQVHLKNGGNYYYKESDIKSINWYSLDGSIDTYDKTLVINNNVNTELSALVDFGDFSLNKSVNIKIDNVVPKLGNYSLSEIVYIDYQDENLKNIMYYVSENDGNPKKESFKVYIEDEFVCSNNSNVWSYAVDDAGNESEISYLGKFSNCIENKK